ncbi:hypothetical protein ABIE65_001335 [Constrictibacter sp. MBR-5]|jgi:hypothetical protein|uniref:DUF465 domain-containing protein n=1 Tax=Constrictibacter sp. MBR-5 TaxID=3156467 RepID=UPI00339A5742
MDLAVRLNSLMAKHAEIEREIETENAKPAPDEVRMSALKKQKLKLKDEITDLQRRSSPAVASA